jgi:hypothetical protein
MKITETEISGTKLFEISCPKSCRPKKGHSGWQAEIPKTLSTGSGILIVENLISFINNPEKTLLNN